MLRVAAVWSGFAGAPGYSNFYFGSGIDAIIHTQTEADTCAGKVRTFFDSIKALIPFGVSVLVDPAIASIDPATGVLQNDFSATTPPLIVAGGGSSSYAAPAGAVASWRTGGIVAGKRIRGRTFLVPLGVGVFEGNGTLTAASITTIQNAGNVLAALAIPVGESLTVWHRPVGGAGGQAVRVTACTVPDKAAVLKSRRD